MTLTNVTVAAACCVIHILTAPSVQADEQAVAAPTQEHVDYFEQHVRPLLAARCFECHGGTKASGGLSLDSAAAWRKGGENGPVIVPGAQDQSLLIEAINYRGLEMPPADHGGKLPDSDRGHS